MNISVKNLCTKFKDTVVHKDLSFDIEESKIHVILGKSGAGKSVLMKVLLGLVPFDSGEILSDGKKYDFNTSRVGVQFQNGALITSLNVGENIMIPLQYKANLNDSIAKRIALAKLSLVGLKEEDFFKYPNMLSGGMVKRIALARALALDPELLLVDEPTSGLDPISAHEYDELIRQLHKSLGITIIMITHDLLRVKNLADKVIIIHDQRAYEGTYKELKNNEEVGMYLHDI